MWRRPLVRRHAGIFRWKWVLRMARKALSNSRNRETGALIEVWPASDVPGSRDNRESWPWITRCVDHGEIRYHKTRGDASMASRRPLLSCRACYRLQLGDGQVMGPMNEYALALGGLYATTPKVVFAAVAVSVLTGCGDDLEEARELMVKEWRLLHGLGIIQQAPPPPTREHREADTPGVASAGTETTGGGAGSGGDAECGETGSIDHEAREVLRRESWTS